EQNSYQHGVARLTPDLFFRPADLPVDVGADRAYQWREHQPRPRDIIPMTTPTRSAPAIVPSGLRRAIPSSSDANVLACSLAEEARSEVASPTAPAALPPWAENDCPASRTVFTASSPSRDATRVSVSVRLATSRRSLCTSSLRRSRP